MRTRTLCSLFNVLEADAGLWWAERRGPVTDAPQPDDQPDPSDEPRREPVTAEETR